MPLTATGSTLHDRLAAVAAASPRARAAAAPADPEAKLLRAKSRIYVACQLAGWLGFAGLELFYYNAAGERLANTKAANPPRDEAVIVMIMLLGLLITHFSRPFIQRWGWKELGWAALLPRVAAASFFLSVVWSAVGFGYIYVILNCPWESKLTPLFAISVSVINGALMFIGWFCIYFVYHAFERLQRMRVEQLRLTATAKEAELRALKSQVNPHFLFNSLNSLRALIDEDAPRAREAVTRLANMLRYSLQSGQLETVPFEDELRIVEDYLALEQIRHEDRLRVRWQISAEARLLNVPPMLLQTLVENAVKYGIGTRREGGELLIKATIDGAALNIRVTNPGDLAAPAGGPGRVSTGVGLRNASERLKLLFGDRATLHLLSEPVGCVTADVMIPLNIPQSR